MREFDQPHLTNPAQHLDLRDAKHAVIVLASIGCVHTDLAKVIKLQTLDQPDQESELRRAGNRPAPHTPRMPRVAADSNEVSAQPPSIRGASGAVADNVHAVVFREHGHPS